MWHECGINDLTLNLMRTVRGPSVIWMTHTVFRSPPLTQRSPFYLEPRGPVRKLRAHAHSFVAFVARKMQAIYEREMHSAGSGVRVKLFSISCGASPKKLFFELHQTVGVTLFPICIPITLILN